VTAGPVTVRRVDGTVEEVPAYDRAELAAIVYGKRWKGPNRAQLEAAAEPRKAQT
jgi:hypothetical protein